MARTQPAGTVLLAAVVVAAALAGGLAVAGAADAQQCAFPVSKVDATGTEVTVDEAPERVVTLSPSAAQTMWEIGAEDKVVGVSKFATYLEGADEKANVSGGGRTAVVVEKVVAQQPDLVLAPNVISNDTVEKLRDAGLTVYRFRATSTIDGVQDKTLLTGELVGECEGARETVDGMEAELATVREAVEGEERPTVLYVFFGFTAGEGTFVDHMIELAGGENAAAAANITGFAEISPEVVAEQDPDWIVLNSDDPTVPETEAYNSTTAVREGNVLVLNASYVSQPAPRVVVPIRRMARAFHPEAYATANATPTPTATPVATPTSTPTSTPSPTPASSPGFGLLVGAVALLLALAAAGSRR